MLSDLRHLSDCDDVCFWELRFWNTITEVFIFKTAAMKTKDTAFSCTPQQHFTNKMDNSTLCNELRNISFPNSGPKYLNWDYFQYYWSITLLSGYLVLIVVFFAFKFLLPTKHHYYRIQVRPFTFIVITHIGGIFSFVPGSFHDGFRKADPCWMYFFCFFLSIPLLVVPIFARLINLYQSSVLTKVAIANGENLGRKGANNTEHDDEDDDDDDEISKKQDEMTWKVFIRSTLSSCCSRRNVARVNNNDKEMKVTQVEIRVHQFWRSKLGTALTITLFLLPYFLTVIILLATNEMVLNNCFACETPDDYNIVLIVEGVIALILLIFAYRMNLKSKDPFGIVNEIKLAVWLGGVPAVILLIFLSTLAGMIPNFKFSPLIEGSIFIYCFFQSGFQCILAIRDQIVKKNKTEQLGVRLMTMQEFELNVLRKGSKYNVQYQEFLAAENSVESLFFIMSIIDWEHSYFDVGMKTSKARARKLIRTYVGESAIIPCNLQSQVVRQLRSTIKDETKEIPQDFFHEAKLELTRLLFYDSYRRFVLTKEYKEVIHEIFGRELSGSISSQQRPHNSLVSSKQ